MSSTSAAAAAPPPPPPQWVLFLNTPPQSKPKNTSSTPDPPGYSASLSSAVSGSSSSSSTSKRNNNNSNNNSSKDKDALAKQRRAPTAEEMDTLRMKKAWEVAIAPAKALPMSAIGMWMSGNSLQIFSIFMLFQLFKAPVQGLLGMRAQLGRFESDGTRQRMLMVKAVYILCNLLGVALGIWKIDKMGLLPTTRSDWLAWETRRMPLERAYPGYPI